jgi:hypothetical protein
MLAALKGIDLSQTRKRRGDQRQIAPVSGFKSPLLFRFDCLILAEQFHESLENVGFGDDADYTLIPVNHRQPA